ncbi:MAG: cell division protein FtsK, partial [Armatimonadota bacterium]|nr:cell division protein FtsK [Armatimonadota bacterium]
IPALVDYEAGKGVVILADNALKEARGMAQSAILRLLATVPPAGVRFVFIDPVSLGGNVAGFMGLEKYEANLIGGKAWSDARHIEQALAEVTDHMETVIQKYLREDYKPIAQYNATARVKEAYRVIVAFDFPVNFSETSAKRLVSIMRNGPRCGVFPLVIVDRSKPLPYGFNLSDLHQFALVIQPTTA